MEATPSHPSSWRTYLGLLGSPLLVVMLVAMLAVVAVSVLSAVRSYVAGESMWSKARAEAVQHVLEYAKTHDERYMALYRSALKVPLSDRQAREAMERRDPRTDRTRQWLIEGGNHPDDAAGMIRLFHWFGDQWVLQDAKTTWQQGDALIEKLNVLAEDLQRAVRDKDSVEIERISQRITGLDAELNAAGLRFSRVLGEAARITEWLLIAGILGTTALLSLMSLMQVRQVLIKQAKHQEAVNQFNRRWELASGVAGLGLYEMDKATGEIKLDSKAAALLGLGNSDMTVPRETVRAMIVPEDSLRTRLKTDEALSSGKDHKIIYRIKKPDGVIRALEVAGRLVDVDKPESVRLMGVVRDVTDELNQAEMSVKRDAAERVAQAQREFLSRLSHELRTPLNAILGFAQLMQMDRSQASPTQVKQADMILSAGQQLLALIEDVLDLSKVESGHIPMHVQRVDALQVLRTCTRLIEGQLQQNQLTLMEHLPQQALWVQADPQRLHQVLINLLTNACKYNRPNGQVSLYARQSGYQVLIAIADTGIGLSAKDQTELFQPFKRINHGTHIEGTGLGLYIVKLLMERMDGDVSVQSEAGKGSLFTIRLPASSELDTAATTAEANGSTRSQTFV